MRIQDSERRAWEEDGFFVREAVFDAVEVARLREAAEQVASQAERAARESDGGYEIDGNRYQPTADALVQYEHAPGSQTLRVIEPFHHLHPVFDALIDDPRLVEPMRDLVGCDRVSLWTDKLNLKRPREGSSFRWHQDSPYWAHVAPHVDQLPNVMVVLDEARVENGCFRVVRGSHTRGILPGLEDEGQLGPLFTDPRHFDSDAQVPIEAPAGSLVFFSPHAVHGSLPNESDLPRRAAVLTYQPGGHDQFKLEGERRAGPG
jgi:ectoine hydroxylase-related dioxygenase (phytanoyl-CoA dioxygenase family)